jgi:hypothetical protein
VLERIAVFAFAVRRPRHFAKAVDFSARFRRKLGHDSRGVFHGSVADRNAQHLSGVLRKSNRAARDYKHGGETETPRKL